MSAWLPMPIYNRDMHIRHFGQQGIGESQAHRPCANDHIVGSAFGYAVNPVCSSGGVSDSHIGDHGPSFSD